MKFEFLEDIAIADIAFRAYGKTREEMFENAALALTEAMADPEKIPENKNKKISVTGKDDEELLYNFLEELVYMKDMDGLLFRKFKVKFSGGKLEAECTGDTLEAIGRENLRNDVKAITMHMFQVREKDGRHTATVVVDI